MPETIAEIAFPLVERDCTVPSARPFIWVWRTSDESSCEIAGRMLEAGRGVARDVKRARALFKHGCTTTAMTVNCGLAKSLDGEECTKDRYACRGTSEHSSSCVEGVCVPDVAVGEKCSKTPCTRGSYCDVSLPVPTCAATKPFGAPCKELVECAYGYCENGRCSQPRHYTN